VTRLLVRLLRLSGMLLYWMHLHPFIIRLSRRHPRILLYHACEPKESDFIRGLKLNVTPDRFDAQLNFLVRHYHVVPLDALERGDQEDRAVVITFDDGYASVYANAFPLLKRRGLPATVYLTTDVVENGAMIWVNELNWLLRTRREVARPLAEVAFGCHRHSAPSTIQARACADYEPSTIHRLLEEIRASANVDYRSTTAGPRLYLTWSEIREMADAGINFGNHTASHPNLARLSELAQADELCRAQCALTSHLQRPTSLAYPFGLHNAASRRVATQLEFSSVMEVGGVNRYPATLDRMARVPVRDWTCAALFAELEIVTPAKAAVRRLRHAMRRPFMPS
jgi:peptidoglycan/xylan/chitin deacetylase (PgdA/CDA1 family)